MTNKNEIPMTTKHVARLDDHISGHIKAYGATPKDAFLDLKKRVDYRRKWDAWLNALEDVSLYRLQTPDPKFAYGITATEVAKQIPWTL